MRTITSLSVFLAVSAFLVASGLLMPKTVSAQVANEPPVITLIGDNPMTVYQYDNFVDPGATAYDAEDATSTEVSVEGQVDTYTLGTYFLTYTSWDSNENSTSTIRTVNVIERDGTAPFTGILNPLSDAVISGTLITITGSTTDVNLVTRVVLRFASYLEFEEQNYCDEYTDIITLTNPSETSTFNWTYDWTPPADGLYCINAYGVDNSNNDESNADRSPVEARNVSFTRQEPPAPTPEPPAPSSRNGGRRHPVITGEVLGESTSTVPQVTVQNVSSITVNTADSVNIAWQTNLPATSQVIYGPTSSGPFRLSLDKTNFGYPSATIENATLTTSHLITLQNMVVSQSYSLRVVSKTNAYTFGPEHRFTLNSDGSVKFEGVYGNEIIIGGPSQSLETVHDFVKTNEDKIKALFAN